MTHKTYDIEVLNNKSLTKSNNYVKKDLPKYWEKDYINDVIKTIPNNRHRMLITFLWRTGVRISECIQFRKKDINFLNNIIIIRWLKNRKYNYRTLPIQKDLSMILQVYTSVMKQEDKVFPFTRQRAWQIVNKYFGGNPHKLRHSFAVNWLRCNGDIVILHKVLGHANIQTTMAYLKIVPNDQRKELDRISFD